MKPPKPVIFKQGWISTAQAAINERDRRIDEFLSSITKKRKPTKRKGK